jgi:anti-sigma factor RsiW
MNEQELEKTKRLLKKTLDPVGDTELQHDLWPTMRQRLAERPARVPWWDWALLAAATIVLFLVPGIIPALLYHL